MQSGRLLAAAEQAQIGQKQGLQRQPDRGRLLLPSGRAQGRVQPKTLFALLGRNLMLGSSEMLNVML